MAAAAWLQLRCGRAVVDPTVTVRWSAAGLPPAYVERQWRAEVPAALRPAFDGLLERSRFFELPEDLGGNDPGGRDMATYSITVTRGAQVHTVRFSDRTQTEELAALRAWLMEHLAGR